MNADPLLRLRHNAWAILGVLTALNFVNYMDRYILAAVLMPLRLDPGFAGASDRDLGLLQAGFMASYVVLSPLGGALGQRVPRRCVVACGALVWSLATLASGLAQNYRELLVARVLVGAGEAGYAAVAPALIADLFGADRRARVLGVFYLATPVGSALGFVAGGWLAGHLGWRSAFLLMGVPGILLALAVLFIHEPARGSRDVTLAATPRRPLWRMLWRNRQWTQITAGLTLLCWGLGALAFWVPSFLQERHGLSVEQAGLWFGGITVAAGVLGTGVGSLWADRRLRTDRAAHVRISGWGLVWAVPFALVSLVADGLHTGVALLFISQVLVFLNVGPLNAALVGSVSSDIRESAVGLNVLIIHLLGDAISPAATGALRDTLLHHGLAAVDARACSLAATAVAFVLGGRVLIRSAAAFR